MAIAREWAKLGHRVVVISSNANHLTGNRQQKAAIENWHSAGVCMVRLRSRRYTRTASAERVISWIDFEWRLLTADLRHLPTPDIVIASSLSLLSVVSAHVIARRYRCPWVFEVRDIWPLTLIEEGGISKWHPFSIVLSGIERFGYKYAALTVGTMPNLVAHVRSVVSSPVKVACIPFGFDPAAAPDPLLIQTKDALGRSLTVGYAGSIGLSNALDTIVRCARQLKNDNRFRFVFAGDGDQRLAYMEMTRDCPNITWLGSLPRTEVHAHLSSCNLLYFATHKSKVWEYGLSLNKLTDYLLSARPVLGSYSGFPSIIDEAGCGLSVPAADEVALVHALHKFLATSPEELLQMGERGRRWLFENRTWARLAADYLEQLELVGASQGGRKS